MMGETLKERGFTTIHADGDADVLVAQTAVHSAASHRRRHSSLNVNLLLC